MRWSCKRSELLKALNIIKPLHSSSSVFPIMNNILVQAYETAVSLTTYRHEMITRYDLDISGNEVGSTTVPYNVFSQLVHNFPDDIIHFSTTDKDQISIECGSSCYNISGLPAADFPEIPDVVGVSIELSGDLLCNMFKGVCFAASEEVSRPVLRNAFLKIEEQKISLVATDTHRLAISTAPLGIVEEPISAHVIVPSKALESIVPIIGRTNTDKVLFIVGDDIVRFYIGPVTITIQCYVGDYIQYENALCGYETKAELILNVENFKEALRRCSIIGRAEGNKVVLNVDSPLICITSRSSVGTAYEELVVEDSKGQCDLAFNALYMIDVLEVLDCSLIKLQISGKESPIVVSPVDWHQSMEYIYVMMPMVY